MIENVLTKANENEFRNAVIDVLGERGAMLFVEGLWALRRERCIAADTYESIHGFSNANDLFPLEELNLLCEKMGVADNGMLRT